VPDAAWREPLVTSSSSSSLPPFILLLTEVVRARIYVCGSHGLKLHAWLGYIYGQLLHAVPSRLDETMTHITRCMPCRVHDSNVISVQSVYYQQCAAREKLTITSLFVGFFFFFLFYLQLLYILL